MLEWLSEIAPVGELAAYLEPPDELYPLDNAFSSEPGLSVASLGGFFVLGLPLPDKVPDYSVSISARGGTRYFTLVDNRRKILVDAPIRASEGYFENALICLKSALRMAKSSNKKIVSTEEGVSAI